MAKLIFEITDARIVGFLVAEASSLGLKPQSVEVTHAEFSQLKTTATHSGCGYLDIEKQTVSCVPIVVVSK